MRPIRLMEIASISLSALLFEGNWWWVVRFAENLSLASQFVANL